MGVGNAVTLVTLEWGGEEGVVILMWSQEFKHSITQHTEGVALVQAWTAPRSPSPPMRTSTILTAVSAHGATPATAAAADA